MGHVDLTEGVVLFADVAGFTPMSEALARSGHYGTEELSEILNAWFEAMAARIAQYGGSVADFAGDALTAVFGYGTRAKRSTARRAVQSAIQMQADMIGFRQLPTSAGAFRLTMKVGLADGTLLETVMGDPAIRLGYVLAGPALGRAVAAERHARSDEVVIDNGLHKYSRNDQVVSRGDRWWLVQGLRPRPSSARPAGHLPLDRSATDRLAPFLHPTIAERLRSGRRELVNEHRNVTAVFVGLPQIPINDLKATVDLQRHMVTAVRLVARYGGHFRHVASGDDECVLVAFFGAPVSHEDDEERAVRCALELIRLPGGPFRAGLATGSAYCGEIGAQKRREYAVIGDSVNLAARLRQAAHDGQLLVDRTTYARVRDSSVCDPLMPITVKGKADPVHVWAVRALRERSAPHGPTPLVGRAPEAAKCRVHIGHALRGAGQVVALTGDAGIGKSRLAEEVVRIAGQLGFAVFGGASRSHATTTSYLVWRSIWRDLLKLDTSLEIAEQQAQIVDRIAQHATDPQQRAPLMAPVLRVAMPDSELIAPLDPEARARLLRHLMLEWLRNLATTTPVLLVIEDCHWIDPASAALLQFLARNTDDKPVLILITAREGVGVAPALSPLAQLAHFSELVLGELHPDDAARLVTLRVQERYPTDRVDPAVLERITDQGEGNPFYLGELVNFLHERGVDPQDARAMATLELPKGVQRLLMARFDQLSEGEKATIKVASVIGRRFRASWISTIYPGAGGHQEVARHLSRLHDMDMTPRRGSDPEPEYQFKHAITQEVAYQSLTFRMRESLHEQVGLLIEATEAGHLPRDYVDLLAHHYGRTRRVDKKRVWFRAAGDAAKAAFANEAAVEHYRRLLPLLPRVETGGVLIQLGEVWRLTGRWAEAEQAYLKAIEVSCDADRVDVLAAGQRNLGDLFMYNRSYSEAVTWLRRSAVEFERIGDRAGLSTTLDRMTFALYQQGDYEDALITAERHLVLATEAGDLAGMSTALNHTGLVYLETGRSGEARTLLRLALDAATEAGDRRRLLYAAANIALVHLRLGEHPPAIEHGRRAFEVAQEIGDRQTAGVVVGNMGESYRDEGDYQRAMICFTVALGVAVELRDWTSVADQVANIAATVAAQGRDHKAEGLFDQAIGLARTLDAPYLLCGWLHRLAKIFTEQGRFTQAARLNQEALAIAETHGERDVQIRSFILDQHLQVTLGRISAGAAVTTLRNIEGAWAEPQERAALLAAQWQLDPTLEAVRITAANLYRSLYETTPTVEYKDAVASLGDAVVAPGRPLPPLPAALMEESGDIDELLDQVARIVPQLLSADPAVLA